jgi:zinc transport system permease protein
MQRAIIAGVVLALLLAWLGVFVIMRRMSFFADGIAHASLAGVAAGMLAGVHPLTTALVFSVVFSIVIYYLEKRTTLSSDAIIGILFTSGMALGVVLISFKQGYQPDLMSFLFGNILAIRPADLAIITALSAVIIAFLAFNHKGITLMALDMDTAYMAGIRVDLLHLTFYIILAVAVVLGLKILGIVLVSALLIIPASTAKLVSKSFKGLIVQSVIFSEVVVIAGIALSYALDAPTGPMIVLVGAGVFLLVFSIKQLTALRKG